ncbi:MAG: AIR synthase related protein [Dehalococcoidia bacterium]
MSLRAGKLPAEMLAGLLAKVTHRDPRVLLGPGIGRDAAVIDLGDRMLVAKTDPITFATEHIGWYAVNVNANDIACMGARPAWMLATALLPPGADDALPARIFDQLSDACAQLEIELVGGHTEVTIGLDRPIVVGAMLGEASRDEILLGEEAMPGDLVLMTKGIAIEGTSLLAREAPDTLRARGVPDATVGRAASLLFEPGISVVKDARIICATAKPRLLHDPTEGGVATALLELAHAAGARIRVDPANIAVLDETTAVCEALGLDPLGLLASGALLAIVRPGDYGQVAAALRAVGIDCCALGRVEAGAPDVILDGDDAAPLPRFDRDELARFFEEQDGG